MHNKNRKIALFGQKIAVFTLFFGSRQFLVCNEILRLFVNFSEKRGKLMNLFTFFHLLSFSTMISLYMRAKIREKSRGGASTRELAEEYGVHISTIQRIISEEERRIPRRGRPLKTTSVQRKRIVAYIRENPLSSAAAAARACGIPISGQTVRRILRVNSIQHVRIRPSLVLPPRILANRLAFARSHVSWSQLTWDRVIFTDEKKFNLVGNDSHISAWSLRHQRYEVSVIQPSQASLMVWGAISSLGTLHLLCTDPSITAATYVDMLENDFFNAMDYDLPADMIWMHDNAPAHRAAHTKEYFERKGMEVLQWPARSPDLNPIENVWGILSQRVYAHGKTFNNTTYLWEAVSAEWRQIKQETIKNLYNSMPKRMVDALQANGKRIKY